MARSAEAILRELVGGLVLIQAHLQVDLDIRADRITELEAQVKALTAEVALLTEQTHARPD